MKMKVGPFYEGKEEDMLTIDNLAESKARKPSVELLESVKLKPTYFSFPSSRGDISPSVPSFRFPHYGYYGIQQQDHPSPSARNAIRSPKSYVGDAPNPRTTIFGTVINTINFFIGIGILALPFGVRKSGWIGLLVLPLLGLVMKHTAILLGLCQYQFSLDTYPDIAEVSFGGCARAFVTFLFYIQLLFEVTIYQVLLVQCLDLLFHPLLSHHTISWLSTGLLILLAHLFTSRGSATWLSFISCLSIVVLCIALVISFIMEYVDLVSDANYVPYHFEDTNYGMVDRAVYVPALNFEFISTLDNFCRYLAIASYCFMNHAVLPSIYRNMKRPSQFPSVVKYSFGIMIISYTLLGVMGYLAYGDTANGNILLNISHINDEAEGVVAIILISAVMVTVATKYALASVPITESLYDWSLAVLYVHYEKAEAEKRHTESVSLDSNEGFSALSRQPHVYSSSYQSIDIVDQDKSISLSRVQESLVVDPQRQQQSILLHSRLFSSQDTVEEEEESERRDRVLRKETLLTGGVGSSSSGLVHMGGREDVTPPPGKMPTPFSLLIEEEQEEKTLTGELATQVPPRKRLSEQKDSVGGGGPVPPSSESSAGGAKFSALESLMVRTPTLEELREVERNDRSEESQVKDAAVASWRPFFESLFRVVVRTLLPFLSMWLAVLFPHFVVLVMFMGGVLGSLISIIIPGACYLRLFGGGLSATERVWVGFIIVTGLSILVTTLGLLILTHM